MADYPPYMNAYGNVTKILDKIKDAKTPERFSQDYLETVLGFSGGSARPFISLAKRIGLLASDGTPTELYRQFRNPAQSEQAMAQAIRHGYPELYRRNEFAHALDKAGLEGLVMEATGLDKSSATLRAIVNTFEALKDFANFELDEIKASPEEPIQPSDVSDGPPSSQRVTPELRLSQNIYLNLPDTTDVAVFAAIFRALKENLFQ
jgi:hypothetical protein